MNHLKQVQEWMKVNKLDLFIINRTDEFLNESIASYAERLFWISNFSGSAGRAIILQKKAAIFIDGRYIFQAHQQVNIQDFSIEHLKDYWNWFENNIEIDTKVGIDSSLHSNTEIKKIKTIVKKKQSTIKYLEENPIDIQWHNQPSYPQLKAFIHEKKYSGRSTEDKLHEIQSVLKSKSIDYYLLTSLDSIAWLLNIRGKDILNTPLLLSFAIVPLSGKIEFFVDNVKITNVKEELMKFVNLHAFTNIEDYLSTIRNNYVVGIDDNHTAYKFKKICDNNGIATQFLSDPCVYPKAQKNTIELSGARKANIRDGVSITKYLYWLKNEMIINETDEIKAANYLYNLRKNNYLFYSSSFDTISAIGANAALPHYKATSTTNLSFTNNSIYLVDSGAQYFDGTTDITRTVIIGKSTPEQRELFTRVLKGHIAIATAKFRINTTGSLLDPLARKSLLDIGCDYDHGTGHGIGSFLNVHEGPQRIAKVQQELIDEEIRESMILSNEPGYYKKNEFGIRIENLIIVYKNSETMLEFETISWAPIDVDLIEINLLTPEEIRWLNDYHENVYLKLHKRLTSYENEWLRKVTKPL